MVSRVEPRVTITLLNYNDRRTVFQAIDSVVRARYQHLELIVIDNNSQDGTPEEIEARIPEWVGQRKGFSQGAWFKFIINKENAGFARGHNQAIREASGEFICCLNSDAILTPTFIEEALKPFFNPRVGAVQGKLLRYDFSKKAPRSDDGHHPVIDTTGLLFFKNRRVVNRGQGEADVGQYEREEEIFGADGAAPVYRRAALEDVAIPILDGALRQAQGAEFRSPDNVGGEIREFFDEDFFMYKEDVDLAWRLRLSGWKTVYNPKAAAYHGRGSGDSMARNPLAIIRERRKINPRAKLYSFRNQRLMQIKNELREVFFSNIASWFLKEGAAWAYALICEGFLAPKAAFGILTHAPRAFRKRRFIMRKLRVKPEEMARWFT